MFQRIFLAFALWLMLPVSLQAQSLQDILQTHQAEVLKPGRRSVGVVLDDLVASGLPQVVPFLEAWRDREVVQRDSDGLFFRVIAEGDPVTLGDLDTGAELESSEDGLTESRPNGGVRRAIGDALVQFQLSDPDIAKRQSAVAAIARSMDASQLAPLAASIESEPDATLKAVKTRLVGMLGALFAETTDQRVAAINALSSDLSVDVRAVLNRILATEEAVAAELPDEANIAQVLVVGQDLTHAEAYDRLVAADLAAPLVTNNSIREALIANIQGGDVGGVPIHALDTDAARALAYDALATGGLAPERVKPQEQIDAVAAHVFYIS